MFQGSVQGRINDLEARADAAEKDAAYQRRHRKEGWHLAYYWRTLWHNAQSVIEDYEGELSAEKERAEDAEKRVKALEEALREYGGHQIPCLRALWREGRPTPDGGYETRYGDKWYPRGQEPPCTCGLDAALSESARTEEEKP